MSGPVLAGAAQETSRLRGAVPAVTVGAAGSPGGSMTLVMVTVTGMVLLPLCPSAALTVRE